MGTVAIRKRRNESLEETNNPPGSSGDWVKFAAGGALIAGGFLLLKNQRRAGMVVGAAGTALAIVDQQDAVREFWNQMPAYIARVQHLIGQVQNKVDEFSARRESLHRAITRGNSRA
jgi:hypothetical protein